MHTVPLVIITNNATIFSEHEVLVDCCHSCTATCISLVKSFQKGIKIIKITINFIVTPETALRASLRGLCKHKEGLYRFQFLLDKDSGTDTDKTLAS